MRSASAQQISKRSSCKRNVTTQCFGSFPISVDQRARAHSNRDQDTLPLNRRNGGAVAQSPEAKTADFQAAHGLLMGQRSTARSETEGRHLVRLAAQTVARRVARRFENPDASVTEYVVVAIDHLRFRSSAGDETARTTPSGVGVALCPGDLVFVEDPCRRIKRIGVAGADARTREK